MYDVNLQPFPHPQNSFRLLKSPQFSVVNFHLELSLLNAVLCPKKVKGYLRVDAELRQKELRELKSIFSINLTHKP